MGFILQMRETAAGLTSQSKWVHLEVTPGWSDLQAFPLSCCYPLFPARPCKCRSSKDKNCDSSLHLQWVTATPKHH